MSSEIMKKNQDSIADRIRLARGHAGLTQGDVAREAGTTPQSWGKYEDGSVSPRVDMLAPFIRRGYSLDWLMTGSGPMKDRSLDRCEESAAKARGEIAATIQSGRSAGSAPDVPRKKVAELLAEEDQANDEMLNEEDAVDQTRYVLRSKTVYRSALLSNIRAFYQGVKREEEMQGVKEEVAAMRGENREMADRMERMEQLLLSLGATAPEKRDPAANA